MRIGLQTWGSDGDIRPFFALAGALRSMGHEVTVALTSVDNKDYSELARSLDVAVIHVGNIPANVSDLNIPDFINTRNPLKQLQMVIEKFFEPLVEEMFEAAVKLCEENEVVVGHHVVHPLKTAAQLTRSPYTSVFLCHSFLPSRYKGPYPFPDLGPYINPVLWKVVKIVSDSVTKKYVNRMRVSAGIEPVKHVMGEGWDSPLLNLVAVSRELCEPAPDWNGKYDVCGFFNMATESEPWSPSDDLREFFDRGNPPVYYTFGSMTQGDPEFVTRYMIESAVRSGCRAIVQSQWEDAGHIPEHKNVFRIGKTPHQNIFPHCSAVVHHGGAGTTQSSLLAGLPSVVVAHAFDQPFWGSELKRIGVAKHVFNARNATKSSFDKAVDKLANAVRNTRSSISLAEKAKIIGALMKEEQGAKNAAGIITRLFQQ